MKSNRMIRWILVLCLLLGLVPFGANAVQTDNAPLKVLAIGNSYSMDSLNHLEQIAAKEGKKLDIGCLFLANGTLSMHAKNMVPDAGGKLPAVYRWYTYIDGQWNVVMEKDLLHGLTAMDWDVITLQQGSRESGLSGTYREDLTTVVNFVNAHKTNPNAKLWWHMTWAYDNSYTSSAFSSYYGQDQERMYNSIVNAVKNEIMPMLGAGKTFEVLIPTGAAIQNARTDAPTVTFNRDGTHLNALGRIIASYTWYARLFGLDKLNSLSVTSFPASYDKRTGAHNLSGTEQALVLIAVNMALADPFAGVEEEQTSGGAAGDPSCPTRNMLDVAQHAWYHEAVDYVVSNKLMNGISDQQFGTRQTLTRAQMVQILYNKEGQPAVTGSHSFPDVSAFQWYNNAVTWGTQRGVMSGYGGGTFGPEDDVTLEQVLVILHNYAGKPAITGDADAVGPHSQWAGNAIGWAQATGILDTVIFERITAPATRAQTAQLLMNYLEQ